MKNLFILAPNDRFNYGDILFPYVVETFFKDCVDNIFFCSTSKADLTNVGGVKTKPFTILQNAPKDEQNHLIIAGGESIFVDWDTIMSYVTPQNPELKSFFKKYHVSKYIGNHNCERLINGLIRIKLGVKTQYPFTIAKRELKNFTSVISNSVGCCTLENRPYILKRKSNRRILQDSDYISVREKSTSKALTEYKIKHYLTADSAILISDIYSEDFLQKRISIKIDNLPSNYIFFQVNKSVEKKYKKKILKELENIFENYQITFIFCPIGLALGHSDEIALKDLCQEMPKEIVHFINNPNIWDIMWLIKHANIYIGTSLHGAITAMSFQTPFLGFGPIKKLNDYIHTWSPQNAENQFCKIEEITPTFEKALHTTVDNSIQKKTVLESFERIKSIIKG